MPTRSDWILLVPVQHHLGFPFHGNGMMVRQEFSEHEIQRGRGPRAEEIMAGKVPRRVFSQSGEYFSDLSRNGLGGVVQADIWARDFRDDIAQKREVGAAEDKPVDPLLEERCDLGTDQFHRGRGRFRIAAFDCLDPSFDALDEYFRIGTQP